MMRPCLAGITCSALILTGGWVSAATIQPLEPAQPINSVVNIPGKLQPVLTAQTTSTTSLSTIEQSVHQQINKYRASKGLPALTLNATITEQARIHSQNMASGKVPFSHDGFNQRVQKIAAVIPYRGAAENVAYNKGFTDPATQAVQGWLKSSGHLTNIEGNYNLTGIGVAKNAKGEYYFTQIFIRTR